MEDEQQDSADPSSPVEEPQAPMQTVTDTISVAMLAQMAEEQFQNLVKAVVDLAQDIMVVGPVMHADAEAVLIANGSAQADLWGINLHPDRYGTSEFIEYDSVINIRSRQGNRSRSVDDPATRAAIASLVARRVKS
jgi:hypothetical protein